MADVAAPVMPSTHVTEGAARPLPTTLIQSIVIRFGVSGINALTGIITARVLNPGGRGELAALILWPLLLSGVTTFGVPSALIYHVRREPARTTELVWAALTLSLITGVLATLAGWFLVPLWLQQHHAAIIGTAQLCLLTTVVCALTLTGRAAWEARGAFALSNLSQLIGPVIILGCLPLLAAAGTLTPATAAATYLLSGVPVVVWIAVSLSRMYRPAWPRTGQPWSRLLHYGYRSYGVDLSGWLAQYLDQALVVGLLMPEAMGIYVVALSLSRVLLAVHGSLAMMVFPQVVGFEPASLVESVARSARLGAMAAGTIGVAVVMAGPTLLRWLYGHAYEPAGQLLPMLVLEVIVAGVVYVLMQGLLAAGRPGIATLVQITGLALSVPLFLVLGPAMGAAGAAIALLASSSFRLVLALAAYKATLGAFPRVWIGPSDFADLAIYRDAVLQSVGRLRIGAAK